MTEEKYNQQIMALIVQATEVEHDLQQAIAVNREEKYATADQLFMQAKEKIQDAHNIQAQLLTKEAQGEKIQPEMLLMHALDLIANGESQLSMTAQIISLQRQIQELANKEV